MRARVRVIALVALVVVLASCAGGEPEARSTATAKTAGSFVALAPDVYEPCGLQRAGDAAWVLGCSGNLVRVPKGSARTAKVPGDIAGLDGLAGGEADAVWTLLATGEGNARRGSVARIDPDSGAILATVSLGASIAVDAVVARNALWVAATDGALYVVDAGAARRVSSGPPLMRVLADGDRLWTVAENGDVVERDTGGEARRTFQGVMPDAIGAAAAIGSLWLASAERGLVRLDPATGNVTRAPVVGTVNAIEPCGGSVWVALPDEGLRALDANGAVTRRVPLSVAPRYVTCLSDRVLVVGEDGRIGSIATT